MNRKLYDENQQFKERNIEQRQQIEHFHTLFQENKQQNEQTLNQLRKERDEAYQRENELKRRMQQTFESMSQKLDEFKSNEMLIINDLNATKLELQQERNKCDLLEKKCKLLDKDCVLIKESGTLEKNDYELYNIRSLLLKFFRL